MPFEGEKDKNHHVVEEVPIQPHFQVEEHPVEAADEYDGPLEEPIEHLEENFELDGNEATNPAPIGRRIPCGGIEHLILLKGHQNDNKGVMMLLYIIIVIFHLS